MRFKPCRPSLCGARICRDGHADERSTVGHTMTGVRAFTFEIRDAFDPLEGYDGDVTLAGVRTDDDGGGLAVGDTLLVPVSGGRTVRATVAQFPLMSFTDPALRAISVVGVKTADVAIGGRAERATD